MYEWSQLVPGILTGMVVIAIAHLALWEVQLPRVPSYVVGTSCVIVGMAVSTAIVDDWGPLIFFLAHLVPAGAVIAFAWAARGAIARRRVADEDARRIREAAERERTA